METDPEIEGASLDIVDVPIDRHHNFLVARLPSGAVIEGTSRHVLGMLHGMMYWDLEQSHPTSPVLHGATVRIGGRRLVVMADKTAGKTTLMLSLLAAGHQVEGDEHLVLEPGAVIARPRTLRVKRGSLRLLPDLAPLIEQGPTIELWDGGHIYAVNPRLFGGRWIIQRGQLDGLVFVEANHGGRSLAKPISPNDAFGRLMQSVIFQREAILVQTARVRRLVSDTPAYLLRLGDLARAEFHLRRMGMP